MTGAAGALVCLPTYDERENLGPMVEAVLAAAPGPGARRRIHLVNPGILVAGFDAVCTDAVGMALMGFDPRADRGTAPLRHGAAGAAQGDQGGNRRDRAIRAVGGRKGAARH